MTSRTLKSPQFGRYRARWREYPGGPQRTKHFARKADAQRFLDGVQGDLLRGLDVDPANGRMLFRDYAEEWRAAQMHRASTAAHCVKDQSTELAPGSVELVCRCDPMENTVDRSVRRTAMRKTGD